MTPPPGRAQAVLITPTPPAARGNGRAMRAELLRIGLAQSFDVQVVVAEGPPAGDPRADVIQRLQLPGGAQRVREAHPLPALAAPATAELATQLAPELVRAGIVVVFRTYMAPLLDGILAESHRPPILLDVDDLESDFHREMGELEEAERFARLEAHYLPWMDAVSACSTADAELLRARHDLHQVAVLPNAVEVPDNTSPSSNPPYDLLFVGNLSYAPNVEGILWLANEVVPRLSNARLAIVGSNPAPQIRELARTGITIAPDVPDIAPWYADAKLAVVPVLHGSGSRIKLIEALAHGLPVVATSRGAAGIPWEPAETTSLRIADEPDAFAAACRELLTHPNHAATGAELVRRHASIDVVATRIDALARSMVHR